MSDSDDIILWADGTWCYRYELAEYTHMSDDYTVYGYMSDAWLNMIDLLEAGYAS